MKIKIKSNSNNKQWAARAANHELNGKDSLEDQDIHLWANSSDSSVASSVTAPPSQTASFYKRVLRHDFSSDDENSLLSDDELDNSTLRSDDENYVLSQVQSRHSSDDGADSTSETSATKKKKKKKKSAWKVRRPKIFSGAIQESADEECVAPRTTGARGDGLSSRDASENNSVADDNEAPTGTRYKVKRRSSIGSMFSRGDGMNGSKLDDEALAQDLGYEDAAPSNRREKSPRRGSILTKLVRRGSLSALKDDGGEETKMDQLRLDDSGRYSNHGEQRKEVARRRGSFGGMFTRRVDEEVEPPQREMRRRRHSLLGTQASDSTLGRDLASTTVHSFGGSKNPSKSGKGAPKSDIISLKDKDMYWLINQERFARKMRPFHRNGLLDVIAKSMANEIIDGLPPTPNAYHGNVGCGKSLEHIHTSIMADVKGSSRKNILSETFSDFGVGIVKGKDRRFYMVTLFR